MEKKSFVWLMCAILPLYLTGQTEKITCKTHYFRQGPGMAAQECWEPGNLFGYYEAFGPAGNSIGRWTLSRQHMYSSVQVNFHANGAVAKVRYSSHPDGGIQWYRSETQFDEQGNQTHFWEDSHDKGTQLTIPNYPPKDAPAVQEIVQEDPLMVSEFWIINQTSNRIQLKVNRPGHSKELDLAPGQMEKAADWLMPGHFEAPAGQYHIESKPNAGQLAPKPWVQEERNRRRYLYFWVD